MRIEKLFIFYLLSILMLNSNSVFAISSGESGDAFIKTWINQEGSKTYTLTIERNPAGSRYPFLVRGKSPFKTYVSDTCEMKSSILIWCGVYSPPAFFIELRRNDELHRITYNDLSGSQYHYYAEGSLISDNPANN
ncbi:hypothetical protein Lqui_2272 [Legionella quinlivanii]|uniref:Uncharacterized protein n=1 Tax=Legionella quinlivanii TaxID=45073 RepID=A0A0W0XTP3_9GAMM|nr:hypothetical protein [Legionella quinlivanii]KTD48008.1 hypothetical protein Lqui_2272 [Legionella quinlivanii]SEG21116.1 hypothetical protein SAMN02746093_02199 [Legionella quinlivanii DSM 21216]STY11121.1 Uncharacterised protein [Legionella quinlivanii]